MEDAKRGFTFCGVDIADLGLEYVPELEDTYVYRPAVHRIHEETYDGHDGGYYYGTSREPKEFILRCCFEESIIDQGIFSRIRSVFRIGRSGKLIFKRRPWCYYYATVTDFDDKEITNYLNGLIKITMKAYYPFARCDNMYCTSGMDNYENIMANSALFDNANFVPRINFPGSSSQPGTTFNVSSTGRTIVLANPGTERAPLTVIAAGNIGEGVTITNKTTGQEMKLIAINDTTVGSSRQVRVDGISGKTTIEDSDGSNPSLAFMYHDYGFIELEPGYPSIRNVQTTTTADSNFVTVQERLPDSCIGKYIYANGWRKIVDITDDTTIELETAPTLSTTYNSNIILMNEIELKAVNTTAHFTRLSFIFKPTFA